MLKLTPGALKGHDIRNIIFDFGGVICDIDFKLSEQKFKELGFRGYNPSYSVSDSQDVFRRFEGGELTIPEFITKLKKHLNQGVTDEQVKEAWNSMILQLQAPRISLIGEVRKSYRIFILSNSNELHYYKYLNDLTTNFGYNSFEDLFEKTWFSFRIHLQKHSKEIFEYVLSDGKLNPSQTLFIDDSIQHIEAAGNLGIRTYHLQAPEDISMLFKHSGLS